MTPGCDELTRADLAKRIAFYSFILLLGAMLLGSFVLRLFGLSIRDCYPNEASALSH
jgi:small neutral amino acid transporter SnatA (MarC family)